MWECWLYFLNYVKLVLGEAIYLDANVPPTYLSILPMGGTTKSNLQDHLFILYLMVTSTKGTP